MSQAGSIRAGEAHIEIGILDRTRRGLVGIASKLSSWVTSIAKIGAKLSAVAIGAGITGFTLAAKAFLDFGEQLNDMSGRTGASVEFLSELSYAAIQSGASMEELEAALRSLSKSFTGSTEGAFRKAVADIMAIEDPLKRVAMARKLLGKGGASLLPMIQDFAALSAEARKFGLIMSSADAQKADALGDAIGLLGASLKMNVGRLVAEFVPQITNMALAMANAAMSAREWMQSNTGLAATLQDLIHLAAGGEMATLAKIAWAEVKVEWFTGLAWMESGLFTIGSFIAKQGGMIASQLSQVFATGWNAVAETTERITGGIVDSIARFAIAGNQIFKTFWGMVDRGFAKLVDSIAGTFADLLKQLRTGIYPILKSFGMVDTFDQMVSNLDTFGARAGNKLNRFRFMVTGAFDQGVLNAAAAAKAGMQIPRAAGANVEFASPFPQQNAAMDQANQAQKELGRLLLMARLRRIDIGKRVEEALFGGGIKDKKGIPAIDDAMAKAEAAGSFSGAVARLLGAGGATTASKQLKVLESIDDGIDDLKNKDGLQFA